MKMHLRSLIWEHVEPKPDISIPVFIFALKDIFFSWHVYYFDTEPVCSKHFYSKDPKQMNIVLYLN